MDMEIGSQHFGHQHPVEFKDVLSDETKEAICLRCGEMVFGSSFSFMECEFYLHKKCAEAPSKIDHPFHRNHPLVLLPKPKYKRCFCNFCGKTCEKSVYHCSCKLDFHIKCALFSLNMAEKKLEELKHITVKVPLLFTEDDNKELEKLYCFMCWEPLLESMYFSLDCGFNLHKKCVELPHEIKYPIHKRHPLILQFNVDHFSCKICLQEPSGMGIVYSCSPCRFSVHIKCAEFPPILNLPCHRNHPLFLPVKRGGSCHACRKNPSFMTCEETQQNNFYHCSSCNFGLHLECASPPLTIKEKIHEHPFSLFWRQASFICDACGLEGNFVSYICSTCNLLVHKKCISLPPIIRIPRHKHPIFHKYFLQDHQFKDCDCRICDDKVNIKYGSYSCFNCKFVVHVKCALEKKGWYKEVEPKDIDGKLAIVPKMSANPIDCVIEKNEDGEMTKIKHFGHEHNLILSKNLIEGHCDGASLMDKYCDGCVLPISNPFYYCSQCDFLLHKSCAKSLKQQQLWFHICQRFLILLVGYIFRCGLCQSECNGFSYMCKKCDVHYCLYCATRDYRIKHQGHKHPLFFDRKHEGRCDACNVKVRGLYKCKQCSFNLHIKCLRLPLTAWHKFDKHQLALTYKEGNEYSEYQFCDICEEKRDPSHCFYHCATCDISAHPYCALGKYPFIKPGSIYNELEDHPHPLTFLRKIFSGPRCHKCGQPCRDLVLECADSSCDYIVHWDCVKPAYLRSKKTARHKTETYEIVPETTEGSSCIILVQSFANFSFQYFLLF
ncbi:hypothetical protein PVK06_009792 [Gossypium arboreum]|uniref:Phorbol-ester/DAG-type domain-containing protein n=1 Tax=Gossypium arboreum TaxID=29729 RepID=A0ABR0QPQ2_GOSAR|nr:hypothetical protein PVK06_009792 [Gossypium arboreum]